ncbi:hypothetical protein BSKO_12887 [Bryopsis sp. KO-2023]|nr:hypothetical protein BSKO_12887 [Bryopsis sp. KO-2023]
MAQTTAERGQIRESARVGRGVQLYDRSNATTVETYKVLSSGSTGYTPGDFQLMEEILDKAEAGAQEEQLLGTGTGEMCLSRVLKSYSEVLRKNSIIPEEDTHFYCLLLKLSLDPNPDWKEKLYNERLNRLPMPIQRPPPAAVFEDIPPVPEMSTSPPPVRAKIPVKKVAACSDGNTSASDFELRVPTVSVPGPLLSKQKNRGPLRFTEDSEVLGSDGVLISSAGETLQESDSAGRGTVDSSELTNEPAGMGPRSTALVGLVDAGDAAAYSIYRFKALAFRRWWNHANVARSSREACEGAVENWLIAMSFWEIHLCHRLFGTWQSSKPFLMEKARVFWVARTSRSCLLQWRMVAKHEKRKKLATLAFRSNNLMLRTLRCWAIAVSVAKEEARMSYHAMRHWRGRTIEDFFHFWWKCVLEKREASKAAEEHCTQYRRRAVLRVWENASKRTLFLLDCGDKIETARHRKATEKAWSKWRTRYSVRTRHRAVLTAASTRLLQTALNRAFQGWKEKTKYEAEVKFKLRGILKKWQELALAKALCRWRDYAVQSAKWKERVRVSLVKMRNRQLHDAFYCWAHHTKDRASGKQKLHQAVDKICKMSMLRSWNSWKEVAAQARAEKTLQRRALGFMTQRTLASAFAMWRQNVTCDMEFREKSKQVLKRMLNLSMGRAFVAWQEWAEHQHVEKEMLHSCVARLSKNVGARALSQWKEQAKESKRLKGLLKTVVHRINNMAIASAFGGWRDRVELKFSQREAISRSLEAITNGLLSRAFNTWSERAELRRQRHKIHDKISLMHQSRIRTEKLRDWRRQCENKRKIRNVVALLKNRQATLALRFWMAHTLNTGMGETYKTDQGCGSDILIHIRKGTLSRAFAAWVDFKESGIMKRENLQKAVGTFRKFTERRAWNSWVDVVDKRQAKGEQLFKAIVLWEKLALSKSWRTWLDHHEHKQATKERLKTAVACFQKFSEAKAFNSWKEFMNYKFVKNDAMEDASIHYEDHLLMASMKSFKTALERRRKLQAAAREFFGGLVTGSLRKAFQDWRTKIHRRKQKKQELLWVWQHFEKQRLTQSFYCWRIQAEHSLLQKDKDCFALKHSLAQTKKTALKGWSEWAKYKRCCKLSVANRMQGKRKSILAVGFTAFRENVQWAKKTRNAVVHWHCSSALRALQLWKDYVTSMRCLEASLEVVLRKWRWGVVAAAYEEWKCWASYKIFKKQQILSAWGHYHSQRVGGLFWFWRKWASNRSTKRRNEVVARDHFVGSTLSGCFECWIEFAIDSADMRFKLGKATAFWANREMAVVFEEWRENAREMADTRTCLQFFKEATSIKAFDTWVWYTVHQQEKRAKLSKALSLWDSKTMASGFRSWQAITKERMEQKAKVKWVVLKLANARAMSVLNTWMDWAKQHKEFREKTAWIVYRIQSREVSMVFNAWVDLVDYQRERQDKIQRAAGFWLNRTTGVVFRCWLDRTHEKKDAKRKLASVVSRFRDRTLVGAFALWRDWAEDRRKKSATLSVAALRMKNRLCHGAFRSWLSYVRYKAEKNGLLSRAVKLISNHEKGMAFRSWRSWMDYKQEKRSRMVYAATVIRNLNVSAAFASWVEWTRCQKEKQSKFRHVAHVLLNSKMAAAMRAWKDWVAWKKTHENLMTTIATRLFQRTLAKGFHSWVDGVEYQRDMRIKAEMAVTLMLNRVVGSAFREWKENVVEIHFDRVAMERAVAFFRNSQLMYAFQGWREWQVVHSEKQAKVRTAIKRWNHTALARAFAGWVDWAKPHKSRRCKLEWAVRKIKNRDAHSAFNTWVAFTIENKIVRITCNRMMSRTLAAAFTAWADRTSFQQEQSEKLRQAIQKLKNTSMSKSFATWVWYARNKQEERRILTKALRKLSLRHQDMAFGAWVDWCKTRREKQAKLASAVLKITKKAMMEGFNAWRDFYVERYELRSIVEQSLLKLANRTLSSAFATWRDHVTGRTLQQAKMARAVAVMSERSLLCAFNTWHEWVEDRLVCRWAVKRIQEGVVHRAFFCWLAGVEKRVANREKVAACVKKLSNKVMLSAFNEWVFWAATKPMERAARNTADQHYSHACMKNVLQMWHQNVCKEKKAITYWLNLRTVKAFQSWCDFVVVEKGKQLAIQKALHHWGGRLMVDSFNHWRYHVAQKARSKIAVECAAKHWTKRSLAAAFNTWREVRLNKKLKKEATVVAVCHWSQGTVIAAFYTWKDQILRLRRLKQLMFFIKSHRLSDAFASWRMATAYWKDKSIMTHAAIKMWQNFTAMKAFESWKHHHRCQTQKQQNISQALHFWRSHAATKAVQSWKECIGLHREQMQHVASMMGRTDSKLASAGFFGFVSNLERRRKAKFAICQWQKSCIRRHFSLWKENVADCQEEAEKAEWAGVYCLKAMLANAFHTWLTSTQECSKTRMAEDFWSIGQLGEAFISWKLRVTEKQQKRESLRIALTHWSGQLLAGAFFCWKVFVRDSLQERRHTFQAIHHWRKLSTSEAFKSWVVYVEWNQSSRLLGQACKQRFAERRVADCFHVWHERSKENKAIKTKLETVLLAAAHRKLDAAVQTWKGYARWRRTCRSAADTIMTKIEVRETLFAWNSWLDFVNSRRMKVDATNHYAAVLMQKGFLGFQYAVHLGRAVDIGQDRINHRLTVEAWKSWLGLTRYRKEQKAVVEDLFDHRSARRAATTKLLFFFSWSRTARALKKGTALLVRIRHRETAGAFFAWLDYTRKANASRELLLKTLSSLKKSILREWRVTAIYLRDERERLDRMGLVIAESEAPAAGFARYSLYRWRNLLLSEALECWIDLKTEHEKDRENSIAAYQHLYFKLAKKTFDAFKEEVEHGWQFRCADMHRKHAVTRTTIAAWSDLAKENRSLRLAGKNVFLAYTTSVSRRALLALKENVFYQSTKRMQEKTACQLMDRHRLAVFFDEWQAHHAAFRHIQENFDGLLAKAEQKQLRGGFQLWRYGAAWSKRLKTGKIAAQDFYESSTASKVLSGWRDMVSWGLYSRGVVEDSIMKRQAHTIANAFGCWREVSMRNTDLLARLELGWANHRMYTLDKVFCIWQHSASDQVEERANEAKAVRFAAFRLQFGVLFSWNTFASNKSALRNLAMELMEGLARRKISSAFAGWRGYTKEAKHSRDRAGSIAKIMLKSQLSRYVVEWRNVAARRVHLKGGLSLFLERWKVKHLEARFKAWQSWSQWKLKKRRGLLFFNSKSLIKALVSWKVHLKMTKWERAISFDQRNAASRSFLAWSEVAAERRSARRLNRLAIAMRFRTLAMKGLRGWWWANASGKDRRARGHLIRVKANTRRVAGALAHWRQTHKACRHSRQSLLSTALQAWLEQRDHKHNKRLVDREAGTVFEKKLLKRVMDAWRSEVQHMQLKRMVFARRQVAVREAVQIGDRIAQRRQKELTLGVFGGWRQFVVLRKNWRQLSERVQRRSRQEAWDGWRGFVKDKQIEEAQALQACSHFESRCLRRALWAWHDSAKALAAEARHKGALADDFFLRKKIAVIMRGWFQEVCRRQSQRSALRAAFTVVLESENDQRIGDCWQLWRGWVQIAREQHAKANLMIARNLRRRGQDAFSVWANYTSAMKRDLDPSSPFLSAEATQYAQKSIRRLSSLVQKSIDVSRKPQLDTSSTSQSDEIGFGGDDQGSGEIAQYQGEKSPNVDGGFTQSELDQMEFGEEGTGSLRVMENFPRRSLLEQRGPAGLREQSVSPRERRGSSMRSSPRSSVVGGGGAPAVADYPSITEQRLSKLGTELQDLRKRLDLDIKKRSR